MIFFEAVSTTLLGGMPSALTMERPYTLCDTGVKVCEWKFRGSLHLRDLTPYLGRPHSEVGSSPQVMFGQEHTAGT